MKKLAKATVKHLIDSTKAHPFFAPRAVFGRYRNAELLLGERCGLSEERAKEIEHRLEASPRRTIRKLDRELVRHSKEKDRGNVETLIKDLLFCASHESHYTGIRARVAYALGHTIERAGKKSLDGFGLEILNAMRILNVEQFRFRNLGLRFVLLLNAVGAATAAIFATYAPLTTFLLLPYYGFYICNLVRKIAKEEEFEPLALIEKFDCMPFIRHTNALEAIEHLLLKKGSAIEYMMAAAILRRKIMKKEPKCLCLAAAHESLLLYGMIGAKILGDNCKELNLSLLDSEAEQIMIGLREFNDPQFSLSVAIIFLTSPSLDGIAKAVIKEVEDKHGDGIRIPNPKDIAIPPDDLVITLKKHFDPRAIEFWNQGIGQA